MRQSESSQSAERRTVGARGKRRPCLAGWAACALLVLSGCGLTDGLLDSDGGIGQPRPRVNAPERGPRLPQGPFPMEAQPFPQDMLPRNASGSGSYSQASRAFYEIYCTCAGLELEACLGVIPGQLACEEGVADAATAPDETAWLACAADAFDGMGLCITQNGCGEADVYECTSRGDGIELACGARPEGLHAAMLACSPGSTRPADTNTNSGACDDGGDGFGCFLCDDGSGEVPAQYQCDSTADCGDRSDERGCLLCSDGETFIDNEDLCDEATDCPDGFDEVDCAFTCQGDTVAVALRCDGVAECPDDGDEAACPPLSCADGSGTYAVAQACDGRQDCADGSDELCDFGD